MKEKKQQPLLIIEDSDEDFTALTRMMNKAQIPNPIYRCEDGEEALDFLYHEGEYEDESLAPRPSLIVLDLNLPGTDGREVLAELKQDRDLQTIPVVIFSTSSNPRDINACYRQGISGYIVKPMNTNRLDRLVQTFLEYWFKTVELPSSISPN
ncbi:MAG: response regulator [Xenococcaceae cyanobacterium]